MCLAVFTSRPSVTSLTELIHQVLTTSLFEKTSKKLIFIVCPFVSFSSSPPVFLLLIYYIIFKFNLALHHETSVTSERSHVGSLIDIRNFCLNSCVIVRVVLVPNNVSQRSSSHKLTVWHSCEMKGEEFTSFTAASHQGRPDVLSLWLSCWPSLDTVDQLPGLRSVWSGG